MRIEEYVKGKTSEKAIRTFLFYGNIVKRDKYATKCILYLKKNN